MNRSLVASIAVLAVCGIASPAYATTLGGSIGSAVVITPPMASPAAGSYDAVQTVTLTASNATTIHYATDGSEPSCISGLIYTDPITVSADTTITATACYGEGEMAYRSDAAVFAYHISVPPTSDETATSTLPAGGNGPIFGSLPGGAGGGGSVVPVLAPSAPTTPAPQSSGAQPVITESNNSESVIERAPTPRTHTAGGSQVRTTPRIVARTPTVAGASTTAASRTMIAGAHTSAAQAAAVGGVTRGGVSGWTWILWILFVLALGYLLWRLYGHYREWRSAR